MSPLYRRSYWSSILRRSQGFSNLKLHLPKEDLNDILCIDEFQGLLTIEGLINLPIYKIPSKLFYIDYLKALLSMGWYEN